MDREHVASQIALCNAYARGCSSSLSIIYASNDFHDAEECRMNKNKVTVLRAPSVPNLACLLDHRDHNGPQWPRFTPEKNQSRQGSPSPESSAAVPSFPRLCKDVIAFELFTQKCRHVFIAFDRERNKNSKRSSANSEQSRPQVPQSWLRGRPVQHAK